MARRTIWTSTLQPKSTVILAVCGLVAMITASDVNQSQATKTVSMATLDDLDRTSPFSAVVGGHSIQNEISPGKPATVMPTNYSELHNDKGTDRKSLMNTSTSPSKETTMSSKSDAGRVLDRDLLLSTRNLTDCVRGSETLPDVGVMTEGIVSFHTDETEEMPLSGRCTMGLTAPAGRMLKIQLTSLLATCPCGEVKLSVLDKDSNSELLATDGCQERIFKTAFTKGNQAEILAKFSETVNCSFLIHVWAVSEEEKPQLELLYTSPTSGYIQTPGWDGMTPHPFHMDSSVRLVVPDGYAVMLSFQSLDVQGVPEVCVDIVKVYVRGLFPFRQAVWIACRTDYPLPALFHTEEVQVQFDVRLLSDPTYSRHEIISTGFRLLFSFHNKSALPEKLPSGQWKCSVPHWPDFRQHLLCNMHTECAEMEDEDNCSYTTDICGPGRISVAGSCYIFIRYGDRMTWNDASTVCRLHGGWLASLNTPEEWTSVTRLLKTTTQDAFLGLHAAGPTLPLLYKHAFQWSDDTIAYFSSTRENVFPKGECGVFALHQEIHTGESTITGLDPLTLTSCEKTYQGNILCEVGNKDRDQPMRIDVTKIVPPVPSQWISNASRVQCPDGHVTHDFLACDAQSACWGSGFRSRDVCQAPLTSLPPSFQCSDGLEEVPYTLVCDHRVDCRDTSDEDFCVYPPCDVIQEFNCGNEQCVPQNARCDGVEHCVNGADEKKCSPANSDGRDVVLPPAVVHFDFKGSFSTTPFDTGQFLCPETHFQCPGDGYCLPVYVRCNGVYDCPGKEDEAACDSYTCPGFYRCRASRICLHPDHVCDGVPQCPQQDDELMCDVRCPDECVCHGLAFTCAKPFQVHHYPTLRFLNAQGSGMNLTNVTQNSMLIYLSLAECNITELLDLLLYNLHSLDLRNNHIHAVQPRHFRNCRRLRYLSLAGNPLSDLFLGGTSDSLASLQTLDVSSVDMVVIKPRLLSAFPNIQSLNLSMCGAESISNEGLQNLSQLRLLDLRGNRIKDFPRNVFQGLDHLEEVYADNYKLCCPETLPMGFNLPNCRAPMDEISSCEALLRSDLYRVLLAVFAALAIIGNMASFVYRSFLNKAKSSLGFGVFVTHLCISDFCMGLYLAIIGIADRVYYGTYLWDDAEWRNHAACKLAGFLSLLSSEVSAFVICLITLDRFIVLRFPFSAVRFSPKSAHVASAVLWCLGLILAAIPLLPVTSHWEFYSQNGICIPLPVTRKSFPGEGYSFGIMIVLNFLLFLLIAAGQLFIFWSIRSNSMTASNSSKKLKDLTIARRLFTVVLSDFLCWFPIGLLGLLAASDVAIPGEVSVAMAIIVLPLNSALNPFLYTVNMMLERRRQAMERRIERMVMTKMQSQNSVVSNITISAVD